MTILFPGSGYGLASLSTGIEYKGIWVATNQTDYSGIPLPVSKGNMFLVEGTATIGDITWSSGDYLIVNENVAVGGTLTDVDRFESSDASDVVKLNLAQTLTNKTIDADDNNIENLTTLNLKAGILQTTVRSIESALDTTIASEKAIASAIAPKTETILRNWT